MRRSPPPQRSQSSTPTGGCSGAASRSRKRRSMSSSERDVYRTARSSAIVRPGAWRTRAFVPVVADLHDGRGAERTIDGHLDLGGRGRGCAAAIACVRSNRVKVPDFSVTCSISSQSSHSSNVTDRVCTLGSTASPHRLPDDPDVSDGVAVTGRASSCSTAAAPQPSSSARDRHSASSSWMSARSCLLVRVSSSASVSACGPDLPGEVQPLGDLFVATRERPQHASSARLRSRPSRCASDPTRRRAGRSARAASRPGTSRPTVRRAAYSAVPSSAVQRPSIPRAVLATRTCQ